MERGCKHTASEDQLFLQAIRTWVQTTQETFEMIQRLLKARLKGLTTQPASGLHKPNRLRIFGNTYFTTVYNPKKFPKIITVCSLVAIILKKLSFNCPYPSIKHLCYRHIRL